MTDIEKKYMEMALEEAYSGVNAGDGGPFGAVIVKEGTVLSRAHNTVIIKNDPTRHAEITAISSASGELGSFKLAGCDIYTTTEPCPMCFSAIHWAGINRIIYGTSIEDVAELGFNELKISSSTMKEKGDLKVILIDGYMREECLQLLKHWENSPYKKIY